MEKYFNVKLTNIETPFPTIFNVEHKNVIQGTIDAIKKQKNTNIERVIEQNSNDTITLEYVHLNPSCGNGTYAYEDAEITPITLGTALIKDIFKISKPHDLKIFKVNSHE